MPDMKILVLSDSHGELAYMQLACEKEKPDWIIHLGDFVSDADALRQACPGPRLLRVAGNCDAYRAEPNISTCLITPVGGLNLYITHGHKLNVKLTLLRLRLAAREAGADIALFGHTHNAYCQVSDGLWMLNPGTCQNSRGSYGVIEIKDKKPDCKIVWFQDM